MFLVITAISGAVLFFTYGMNYTTFSYKPAFNLGVIISPYEKDLGDLQYFVHSKIYIIDEEVIFTGSVNFTDAGFIRNYECWTRITDRKAIREMKTEVEKLFDIEKPFFANISDIGANVYEPSIQGTRDSAILGKRKISFGERLIFRFRLPLFFTGLILTIIFVNSGSPLFVPFLILTLLTIFVGFRNRNRISG